MPAVRRFRVRAPGERDDVVILRGDGRLVGPIAWSRRPPARAAPPEPPPLPEASARADTIAALAAATARAVRATAEAHAAFLDAQDRATAPLARLIEALSAAAGAPPRVARPTDPD